MTTLDEVKRYNVLKHEMIETSHLGSLTASEILVVLATDFDRLQSELSALKQAVKDARPAIEDAVTTYNTMARINTSMKYGPDEKAEAFTAISQQLRGLLSLSEP